MTRRPPGPLHDVRDTNLLVLAILLMASVAVGSLVGTLSQVPDNDAVVWIEQ